MEEISQQLDVDKPNINVVNRQIAKVLGLEKAILYSSIAYWQEYKESIKAASADDGLIYIYNTAKSWHKLHPYLNVNSIPRYLKELEKDGYIFSRSDLNKKSFDKTKWFAINPNKPLNKYNPATGNNDNLYFNVSCAKDKDIATAIIFENIKYFLDFNLQNNQYIFKIDNKIAPFVRISPKALSLSIKCISTDKIKRILNDLEDSGILYSSKLPNKDKFCHANWYTISNFSVPNIHEYKVISLDKSPTPTTLLPSFVQIDKSRVQIDKCKVTPRVHFDKSRVHFDKTIPIKTINNINNIPFKKEKTYSSYLKEKVNHV